MNMKRPEDRRGCTVDVQDAFSSCLFQIQCLPNYSTDASYCTLQRVEDGEEVHEGQADGSPGKQSEAPRHTEQEGEADDASQVS